ncbi:MAG: NADH-quinone oxidoreductase subunit NuoE, partial [bacterium]|nr:NADH-quinone oxidoreductase subunit NuoE [bacterium]
MIDLQPLRDVLSAWPDLGSHRLIAVLQKAQDIYGYLPEEAMELISEVMRIPMARIYGVVTFYAQFRREPRGLHVVEVCNGTACHVKGAGRIIDELVSVLGIRPGETTDDGRVTLVQVNCVGACGIAPALVLDGKVYGHMTPAKIRELIEPLLEGEAEPAAVLDEERAGTGAEAGTFLDRCCDKCRNTEGTPCPEFLICKLENKPCHDDEQCAAYRGELRNLLRRDADRYKAHIFLCKGLTCDAGGAAGLRRLFEEELSRRNLLETVEIVETGCQGLCEMGPVVQIKPLEAFYCRVQARDVAEIVEEHIAGGKLVERLLYSKECSIEADIPFYKVQERRVLSNMGRIDPRNIDEYIARNGYLSLYKAVRRSTPEEIIEIVSKAGLRGRGG